MNSNNNKITDNDNKKIISCRKPINKIMNINYLKHFSNTKDLDNIILLYSSKKSYISPKSKILKRKKIDNNNEIKRKISPNQQKNILINKKIKNNLYNQKDKLNSKENKKEKKEIKIYNYKKKVNMNKHKLNSNKNNNLILGSLIDNETEGTFDNNSLEKVKANKIKNFVVNKINENEKNKNNRNNIFDMGSISHISKNGSSSAKEKNIEEEIKNNININNNNPFEKIVCDFIEEENCKNLFQGNDSNKENIGNNNENNPINQQYKSKALNEILTTENNNNNKLKKQKHKNHEKVKLYKQIISKFIDSIMYESKNDVIFIEKFVEDIFIESIAKNFVKIIFEEIMNEFKKKKEEEKNNLEENIKKNNLEINIKEINNKEKYNNIGSIDYKKLRDELNINKANEEENKIILGNNTEPNDLHKSLDVEKENNHLLQSQENKNIECVYKRLTTLPNVSKNFRFGFYRKNSIRREYQQRRYKTLNLDNFIQNNKI